MLHKAVSIACGAFCCTATSSLQVETGELALALRRSQQEIKYSVKVKATEGHPAKSATEIHWTALTKKFKPNNLPIYFKTLDYFFQIPKPKSFDHQPFQTSYHHGISNRAVSIPD